MQKKITIDGKEMTFRASALVPRLYRYHFGRDIMTDMKQLDTALKKNNKEGQSFGIADLSIFENVAWLFLKLGGEEVGANPDEWLDSLEGMFSVYEVLPELLDLWNCNLQQTSIPKKK